MDHIPETPLPEDPASAEAVEDIPRGRRISWLALMLVLVMPLVWLAAFFVMSIVRKFFPFLYDFPIMIWLPIVGACAVAYALGRAGLRRGWANSRKVLLGGWSLLVIGLLAILLVFPPAFQKVRQSSQSKVVRSNLKAFQFAAEQYCLENGAIFATYDDLVGPSRHIKGPPTPVMGEDYRSLGPIRQDHTDELRIKLPDGRVIDLYPPSGVPDGLRVVEYGDLRFETTYRHGWPDGPSRVVTKKGHVLSSANYVEGHIVGPCWYNGKDLNSPANRPPDALGRE